MKVLGVQITAEQEAAGTAAMQGTFRADAVRAALATAGVPEEGPPGRWGSPEPFVRERAADRFMQRERKAGRIRAIDNKNWERIA